MKAQNIEFKEIDSEHLGSEHENKVPPKKSWQHWVSYTATMKDYFHIF